MLTQPRIIERAAEPFAAIMLEVTQREIAERAPPLIADVMAWVKRRDGQISGPPFFSYVTFLPAGRMRMMVGVATATVLGSDGLIVTGELPAGRYASVTHRGPYAALYEANMGLDAWIRAQGFDYAGEVRGDSFVEATRLEIYREPGSATTPPVTEVAFRLKA
ncbi:MAG: GyrI-like domain-containing protein [Devosia sp.]